MPSFKRDTVFTRRFSGTTRDIILAMFTVIT